MLPVSSLVEQYLTICARQKNLNAKTVKAYRIDLRQFHEFLQKEALLLSREALIAYVMELNQQLKPKSVKRKLAAIKAFCHYLADENLLETDPFQRLQLKFQEPFILPRTVPLRVIEALLSEAYRQERAENTGAIRKAALRDVCVLELLFATGMRVSELCALNQQDIDLVDGDIRIYGKGAKERRIQVGSSEVLLLLQRYYEAFSPYISHAFFLNRNGDRLSEQSVRSILKKLCSSAEIRMHITPHMLRHSFATFLLEEDVDIRYIQRFLGHSSIVTTQIYTHVATAKQRDILKRKHPRNRMVL